ncbi:MAG: glycosyltransferase, partial [Bacteroidales bacterium]|nr:glycosyltransferase [Bacteroidales bacterium]
MPDFSNLLADKQWFIVFVIFIASFAVQLFYYFGVFLRFVIYRSKENVPSADPVSVVICARNEAENLDQYLPLVLTQDYPDYEVIVVDDCSTDDSDMVIKKYLAQYPRLRTSLIKEDKKFSHGKKLAVTIGIKAAKFERLLFIDADCRPESDQWLKQMTAPFSDKISIVLGYGGFFPQPGILNKYIRYDTMIIALQYFSYALCRVPYMGVGRNLAYKRSLFYSGSGFTRHFHLASGDDDLFVNENATKTNTAIVFSHDSHTRSTPKQSFDRWAFQKKRHYSTSKLYKPGHKIMLGLEPLSRLLFYASCLGLLFYPPLIAVALAAFGFRLLTQLFVIKKTMIRLNEKNLLVISLLFDLMSLFINVGLYVSSRIRPANY